MKAKGVIFRKLTANEFKAITNSINSQNGGSQTYIDFPKGAISDSDFKDFFGEEGRPITNGFEWKFKVNSLSIGKNEQEATISARRDSSNSLREQNNENRIEIWKSETSGFPDSSYTYDDRKNPIIVYIIKSLDDGFWAGWFYKNECTDKWFMNLGLSEMFWKECGYINFDSPVLFDESNYKWPFGISFTKSSTSNADTIQDCNHILNALHTKPFLLLAGISGTGKSRKVQELAYLTCKRDGIHDKDETAPGNYMLIPVKPNWHDSTELLGYYSSITGKYVLTDFIRFVWKAWVHKDVPYFLCLDEMNLAPVEQYFAEYLSILETRKLVYDEEKKEWHIQTAEILSKKIFENLTTEIQKEPNDKVITYNGMTLDPRPEIKQLYKGDDIQIINFLKENGLRLPENLFVIGTVNMDDTTHQFSRKVIDRAFTIEMNGDELTKMFDAKDTLAYLEDPMTIDEIRPLFVKAQEVLEAYPSDANTIKTFVPEFLNRINGEGIFKDTPFRVSYRVQNELVLYYASIRPQGDLTPDQIIPYLQEAFMAILLEKILPRVEGDEKAMKCNEKGDSTILLKIKQYLNEMKPIEGEPSTTFNTLIKKLDEMNERVKNSYFTSFFS